MAVTGRGDYPFRSSWLGRGRGRGRGANPRKVVNVAVTDANRDIWQDWAFEAGSSFASVGSLSKTLGSLTLSAAADLAIEATFSRTLGTLTATSTADLTIRGTLDKTLGTLTGSATANLGIDGATAGNLAPLTLVATGELGAGAIGGALDASLDGLSLSATGGLGSTTGLTGRRPRGRRIIYPDELDPLPQPVVLEAPEPLPSLEVAEAALIEAKAALEQAIRTKAEKKQAKERAEAIATLETALRQAQAQYDAARERENAIIQRIRDEDEFWLLAA